MSAGWPARSASSDSGISVGGTSTACSASPEAGAAVAQHSHDGPLCVLCVMLMHLCSCMWMMSALRLSEMVSRTRDRPGELRLRTDIPTRERLSKTGRKKKRRRERWDGCWFYLTEWLTVVPSKHGAWLRVDKWVTGKRTAFGERPLRGHGVSGGFRFRFAEWTLVSRSRGKKRIGERSKERGRSRRRSCVSSAIPAECSPGRLFSLSGVQRLQTSLV